MTLVLAFDTATRATVAAVLRADGTVVERRDDPPAGERPRHAQMLLALCDAALADASAAWDEVTRIGAGVGPGSFTGLRIGVATARALALARGIECVPVSTLAALAWAAPVGRDVLAVLDARRGEAFVAVFAHGEPATAAMAVEPAALPGLGGPGWLAIGDGAVRYRAELESAGIEVPADADARHAVGGAALAALAVQGRAVPVATLVPDYVRLPDAEVHHRRVAAGP